MMARSLGADSRTLSVRALSPMGSLLHGLTVSLAWVGAGGGREKRERCVFTNGC